MLTIHKILLNMPFLLLSVIVVGVTVVISTAGILFMRRFISHQKLKSHNDIAGAIFGTLGMAYTVLIAFVVVTVWQSFDKATFNTEREANCLVDLYRDSESFSEPSRKQIRNLLNEYAQVVTGDEWQLLSQGKPSPKVQEVINKLNTLYSNYLPKTITDQIFFEESVRKLNELCELRRERLIDSRHGTHPMLWFVLIVGAIFIIAFTSFFGSENLHSQVTMSILLSVFIALILLTILAFDYPFTGSVNISPEPFKEMLKY
ncbi:MAG: DUF4239 domain-containing protein [Candidatus Omnitrophota bacterium]|nr:DUF4239 domain-containing protein [Candidatus Omnitrophota bacterium]